MPSPLIKERKIQAHYREDLLCAKWETTSLLTIILLIAYLVKNIKAQGSLNSNTESKIKN